MARNVEIKARVSDPGALRSSVQALARGEPEELIQEDTFFHSPEGRLKLRKLAEDRGELIAYERADEPGPRESEYVRVATSAPDALASVLSRALGARAVVRKRRTVFHVGPTRVHLDAVEGLGAFVELEVVLSPDQTTADGARIARELMRALGIRDRDLVREAYVDLLERAASSVEAGRERIARDAAGRTGRS